MNHPNATAAGGSSIAAVLVVWIAGVLGLDMPAEVGAAISGGAAVLVLLIGREGIRGIASGIWRGSGKPVGRARR